MPAMQLEIIQYPTSHWANLSARYVQAVLSEKSALNDRCAVMLTGGRSAERLMLSWAKLPDFVQLHNIDFFFGDERCVPPEHEESNFGLAMRTLFRFGIPTGCVVHRIKAESRDKDLVAKLYAKLLPDCIDLLLLGVGEDGHIASLFPGSTVLNETRKVVPVIGPKPPAKRITITSAVIGQSEAIVVLASGIGKLASLKGVLCSSTSVEQCPARLAQHATWLIDFDRPVSEST
jgi:6-phosphogluconolactonase